MASRKEQIRRELKKKQEKEGLNPDAVKDIVDLKDDTGEDIKVEDFHGEYNGEVIPFSTTPHSTKKGLVAKIKGVFDDERKQLKKLDQMADEVLSLEPQYQAMSDAELANQTNVFKEALASGKTLDDIIIDAYAVVREAAYRKLGLKAFKVQIMGAITLHEGDIAEMKTGEGKTLTSIFPVYLNALTNKGVHVVTVNDYLAGRDAQNNGLVFNFLGLTVGLNKRELTPLQKQQAHGCDITYTTNAEVYNRLMSDSPSTTTVLEFTTQQRDALTKMFNKRAVDNYVFAQSITYLGKNDAEKAFRNFNSASQIFESALSNLASDSDIVTKWNATASDAGRFVVMQQYLNGEFKSSLSLTKEQRSALVTGTRGYQKVMDTMASHVIKGTRSGAGEIDTAFFVADSLLTQITSDETIDASLRFTQEQINQINLVRMSAKEGFLSPKHAAVESTSKGYQNFVKNVNEAFNMLLNANADHDKAEQMLIENITTFGRTMEEQTSLDILKDKFDDAGNIIGHTADVDKEKFRAHITAGVRQIRSIFENLNDDIRTNIGTLKSQMMASGIDQATRLANAGAVTPASLTAAGVSELLDMDGTTEALFKSQQQNAAFFASATDAANSVQQTVNRSKQAAAKIINPNLPRKLTSLPKNWTSLGLGLAAGLMFAGYAGGNPSEPVGTEAQPRQGEEQSQQIQQMPRLTDSALSSMRGGPKQGYIININAQTKDDTEYASRLISQAVRDNFSNTQINISMNVNQTQTSMDGNDLYEYLANSL